jgi:murein DD-endopeptidase MepM/ murein hydrolase activator NlpD
MRRSQYPIPNLKNLVRLALLALTLLLLLAVSAIAQEPTPEPQVYVVEPGDTLFQIAERFGSTVEAIVAANDIENPSLINPGQELIIPVVPLDYLAPTQASPNTRMHYVRAGETLASLAFRYGTTIWTLREVNDLHPLGLLWPGQPLAIPTPTAPHTGVPSFPEISAFPAPVVQGQTMLLEVKGDGELDLSGSFLERDLLFFEEEGRYWALAGVDALTPSGGYHLALDITEAESGDLLTMQEIFTITEGSFTTYNVIVPADRTNLLDPALVEAERRKVNAVFAGVSNARLWDGLFGYPLEGDLRTTAGFGQRRSYGGGPVTSYHAGHDLGADGGTPVLAPMTATVALAEPLQVRGNVVILDHGLGVFTGFWHLSRIDVTEGQRVGQGEVVALVGSTGLSTGPHLHWEMRVLGVPVDPFQWTQHEFPPPTIQSQVPITGTRAPFLDPQAPIQDDG